MTFTVIGKPEPQGSVKAFTPKGWSRPILTSDNKRLKPWRQDVAQMSQLAMQGRSLMDGPVRVEAAFYFARPKSKPNARHKLTKPDVDKLVRGILDGLTSTAIVDDSQVVALTAYKLFGVPERAVISVEAIDAAKVFCPDQRTVLEDAHAPAL